jgi:GT2 family glycosyltransferase/glycosyltransferase involved in cell wall biosynthesis
MFFGRTRLRVAARLLVMKNPFRWLPPALAARLLVLSGLFDARWYQECVGLNFDSAAAAARHFVGAEGSGSAANPLFDADWYRRQYGFIGSAAEALLHYWLVGDRIGLRPHPWFDPRFFRARYGMHPRWGQALRTLQKDFTQRPNGHPHFDAQWYLDAYPDVRAGDENPLVHFVHRGAKEGRQPNRYFVPRWYLQQYPDVAAAGIEPALHFNLHGALEGRSPGPEFDPHQYALRNPGQRDSGLDPLAHYLTVGRAEGAGLGPRSLKVMKLRARQRDSGTVGTALVGRIDVVVPVYRDLEVTRNCLESVLGARNTTLIRLRIHNDASPEPEVTTYLRQLAREQPEIFLMENERNLGFVGTVNVAMRAALQCADSLGVVLLNSDTEVAADWIDRLFAHAQSNPAVGTVTALSNNATICSFPRLGANAMPAGCKTAQLDALAAAVNAGEAVAIPTGVGYCMLITRRCLETVGLFDEEAFGRGYGEENDFCMRASALGFRHLLALDVFVQHVGEVSFADDSKRGKVLAEQLIRERYPDYARRVADFVASDPGAVARIRLTLALWRAGGRPVHALVTHDCGGGTERHVQEVAQRLGQEGHVVILRPSRSATDAISLENQGAFDAFAATVSIASGTEFAELLEILGVTSVQIHHLMGHRDAVREGLALAGRGYEFVVHDYFTICPQVTLTAANGRYCGEPGLNDCDACIRVRPSNGAVDIRNWRIRNEWAVLGADRVLAPSKDAAARIQRYFGVLAEVQYHEQPAVARARATRLKASARPSTVALLGALARHKGRDLVFDAAIHAGADRRVRFYLIGDPQGEVPVEVQRGLRWTGPYQRDELEQVIDRIGPDGFLFPSQCPETYSYTLTEAMATGLPIIATDIGAFRERLARYPSAKMIPHDISGANLVGEIARFLGGHQ